MSLGFAIAVLTAQALQLDFAVSAGIIAMLNMLDSKKKSARVAWRRVYSSAVGLLLAVIVFSILGYETINLTVFLLLFIPLAIRFKAREGIIVNTVLASHLISYHTISTQIIFNEFTLVLLGAVIALLVNLHMPNQENDLKEMQVEIEQKIRTLLWTMSLNIRNLCNIHDEEPSLIELESLIKEAKKISYTYMNNHFLNENTYYLEYFQMRLTQLYRLMYMREHLDMVFVNQGEAMVLSKFTGRLAYEYDEGNDGKTLLLRLQEIRKDFKNSELPSSQLEFENRAALFQYLNDLEEFISLKVQFAEKFPELSNV
tara:strand:- start:127 stop:1068 length:942 start_codon:yes stop_codon:yes gene_type:complete